MENGQRVCGALNIDDNAAQSKPYHYLTQPTDYQKKADIFIMNEESGTMAAEPAI